MKTVREMRIEQGKTQAEMAALLGVSRPTYIKFENDPSAMTIGFAKRVCSVLKCDVKDIFFAKNVQLN